MRNILAPKKGSSCDLKSYINPIWDIPWSYPSSEWPKMPEELAKRIIYIYSKEGDVVLDPFAGAGTVAKVCFENG